MALSPTDLETVWTSLATRLSDLVDGKESLFLAKLVILLANECHSAEAVERLIGSAASDL